MTTKATVDSWSRALVYGLGLSGRAAARLLLARGVEVRAVDSRAREELELERLEAVDLVAGLDEKAPPPGLLDGVDAVVASPGVPLERPVLAAARERGLPVLAEVEIAFAFTLDPVKAPVVAVTGSNGKSTTTALAGAMLRETGFDARVCGNIGTPLAAEVAGLLDPDETRPPEGFGRVFVVELSSFQLASIEDFRPRAAALLNVAADHLDWHGGLDAYTAAKRRIFENQGKGDTAVINADDPRSKETEVASRRRLFSLERPVRDGCFMVRDGDGDRVVEVGPEIGERTLFDVADVPLAGGHNVANAMAAALLARSLGAPGAAIRRGLTGFRGLPHRMERVAERGGVVWYDDSKGTNPAATIGCLKGFADGSVHLILGGKTKGADLDALVEPVSAKAVRVYLIGESQDAFAAALGGAVPISRCGTLERAVEEAASRAEPRQVVLLSPACASFDQFRDFNHRGDVFQRLVRSTVEGARGQEAGV